jgi:pantothenate synthetase
VAPRLYEALRAARAALRAGETTPPRILAPAWAILRGQPELRVQYLEVVDAGTLAPRDPVGERSVVAVAAFLGRARLIDNVIVRSPRPAGR